MAAAVIAVVATIVMFQINQKRPTLVVQNQETGQVYYQTDAQDGLKVTLRWIHSIEHEPWQETYFVEGNGLILDEIAIKSYGAGVDGDPGGITTVENGVIYTREINRRIEDLRWVHSHDTKHTLRVGDHLIDTTDIEHRAFVVLKITE